MDPRPRSRPRSPAHAASRRIAQGAALALGALAFLRAPLGPSLSPGPAWPPATEPRAHAASQPAPAPAVVAFALATPPPPRHRSPEPPAWRGPYRAFGPVEPRLHPVGWTAAELADAVDERLVSLEDLGDDEAGRDVLFLLGAEHQAQGDFLGAAEYYEAFAAHSRCAPGRDRDARCDAEVVALENAALFREALGQPGQSQANAALLAARHALAHPRAATRLALRVGDALPRSSRAAQLEALRRRRLPPAEAILAELRLGRAREGRAARAAFRRADRLWERHGGPLMAASPGLAPTEWAQQLGQTREAVAEARFELAQRAVRRALGPRAPRFEGAPTERRVARWVSRRLAPWLRRRLAGLRRAEAALDRVDALGLSQQSVATAAQRGDLHQRLADDLASVALPERIDVDDELIASVGQPEEPLGRRWARSAVEGYRACMEAARETGGYGPWSERCADGLARHDPAYAPRAELAPEEQLRRPAHAPALSSAR